MAQRLVILALILRRLCASLFSYPFGHEPSKVDGSRPVDPRDLLAQTRLRLISIDEKHKMTWAVPKNGPACAARARHNTIDVFLGATPILARESLARDSKSVRWIGQRQF
jgi:hypothetical protein